MVASIDVMMIIRIFLATLTLVLIAQVAHSQKQNNIWYFGERAGIDFNSGSAVVLNDGMISTTFGCASVADRTTGKLLFYTEGNVVWNRNHKMMPHGGGLR